MAEERLEVVGEVVAEGTGRDFEELCEAGGDGGEVGGVVERQVVGVAERVGLIFGRREHVGGVGLDEQAGERDVAEGSAGLGLAGIEETT